MLHARLERERKKRGTQERIALVRKGSDIRPETRLSLSRREGGNIGLPEGGSRRLV